MSVRQSENKAEANIEPAKELKNPSSWPLQAAYHTWVEGWPGLFLYHPRARNYFIFDLPRCLTKKLLVHALKNDTLDWHSISDECQQDVDYRLAAPTLQNIASGHTTCDQ